MNYPIIIHKDKDSDYGVTIPDLLGCFSAGETLEEAIECAEEAALAHIEGLILDNEEIPEPSLLDRYVNNKQDKNAIFAIVAVDLAKLSGKSKRINISIPERILTKLDNFANRVGESRSGFLVHAAMAYIKNNARIPKIS